MKCESCRDKIWIWQKRRTRINRDGKKLKYHKGCFELLLDKLIDKVKANIA